MKLLYVTNSFQAGGAERHLLNLTRDMIMHNHQVWVAVLERKIHGEIHSLEPAFVEAGVNVIHLTSYAMFDIGRWLSLLRLAKKLRPDIIHSHLPRSDLSASVVKFLFPDIYWISTIHDTYTKDKY